MSMNSRALLIAMSLLLPVASASASSLRGSHASMVRQHSVAVKNDFTFLRTASQVKEFAASDRLENVDSTRTYHTDGVSFPYARPVVKLFIERLAQQFYDATGTALVITSLTRPTALQPRNASPLSVHPTGMAVDLRVPANAAERGWLERTLLSLEDKGLLDVTREHNPSHYHVAVFPEQYAAYAAGLAVITQTVTNATMVPEIVSVALANANRAVAQPIAATSPAATPFVLAGLGIFDLLLFLWALGLAHRRPRASSAQR